MFFSQKESGGDKSNNPSSDGWVTKFAWPVPILIMYENGAKGFLWLADYEERCVDGCSFERRLPGSNCSICVLGKA